MIARNCEAVQKRVRRGGLSKLTVAQGRTVLRLDVGSNAHAHGVGVARKCPSVPYRRLVLLPWVKLPNRVSGILHWVSFLNSWSRITISVHLNASYCFILNASQMNYIVFLIIFVNKYMCA